MSTFPFNRPAPVVTARGRIKPGTIICQDFAVSVFPVMPRDDKVIDPNTVFNIEPDPNSGRGLTAWRDGYGGGIKGRPGAYGCGELTLFAAAPPEGKEKP